MGVTEQTDELAVEKAAVRGGRPLFLYFLPSVVIGILLMLLIAVMAQQTANSAAGDAARLSAKSIAAALAGRRTQYAFEDRLSALQDVAQGHGPHQLLP